MRRFFLVTLFAYCSIVSATTYYVAPSGNDSNPGTIDRPWGTWGKAFSSTSVQPGDVVYFRGGVYFHTITNGRGYSATRSGTASDTIYYFNYPGEVPILDCNTITSPYSARMYSLNLDGVSYVRVKGLTIRNVQQRYAGYLPTGLRVAECNHVVIENCIVHDIDGHAVESYWNDNTYFINCDVYNACDSLTSAKPGNDGNGFFDFNEETTNKHVYFKYCRAWNCGDQGFSSGSYSTTEWEGCWSFNNGILEGKGWGFKLGWISTPNDGIVKRIVKNCIAANNRASGIDTNDGSYSTTSNMNIYNNTSYHNGSAGFTGYGFVVRNTNDTDGHELTRIYRNNIAYGNYQGDIYLPAGSVYTHSHNSWDHSPSVTVSNADFLSLDYTEMRRPRKSDGSLPDINFLKLASTSDLIDAGTTSTGISYKGSAPDLGWYETSGGTPTPAVPVYVGSAIENATPSRLEMTYNLTLANIAPASSAFTVRVNSVARSVSSVAISATKVMLTLSSPVVYGDVVTVAYTKPSSNPIQTADGGQAATISAQPVTNRVSAPAPVYQSSVVANSTPSVVEMNYSLALASIVPAASAFTVRVNSVTRSVSSVAISGTRVLLTLSSPVLYGDAVTVAYTRPSSNPLQTVAGGQAATISAQSVTNSVSTPVPVYQSSAIENSAPSVVEMTYNLTLASIVPAASAFTVRVNTVTRSVSTVAISGTRVLLTLASPVVYGDAVTVAYTKPSSNPLQTSSGGQAATIGAQTVTNRVSSPAPVYQSSVVENTTPAVVEMTYNLTLASIVPASSAFTVRVNTVARSVNAVAISGTRVLLTLASPVAYGDAVTIAYTKPSSNPLQTATGGEAATISSQAVTNSVTAEVPLYQSSAIENSTPSVIDITYNLTLANIVPASSAFTVRVNTVARSVSAVAISGTRVLLTIASPVVYGDAVTVAYTKPSSNPLQTSAGGQAATISAQTVTNRVGAPVALPIYVSSAIENAAPTRLEMTYDLTLANIVPTASAFTVRVNSTARSVSTVSVSGTKVLLTLSSQVNYGDVVTVAYTKPTSNPLQTSAGGQAATISAQSVSNRVGAPAALPVYVSSAIENAAPSRLEMTYDLALANIVPTVSAFTVRVNSSERSVSTVAISGTTVLLTLSSPVIYSDVVTVSYTKPSSNPLQTSAGGQAATISAQTVSNRVGAPPALPVYTGSAIENASPSRLEMSYDIALANILPAASAFTVRVNSTARSVSTVAISGTKVLLTLASPVVYGDVVTVSYTRPSSNPLQTSAGGLAATIGAQTVTNRVSEVNTPPIVVVNYKPSSYSGFVDEINASGSYDSNNDNLTFTWAVPGNVPVSSTSGPTIKYLGPIVSSSQRVQFTLNVSDGKTTQSKVIPIDILPYKPDLSVAEISKIEASSYEGSNYPYNIVDGNLGTMWSANGDNEWLVIKLKRPFRVDHVKLAFQAALIGESYFDILGSTDQITWEPILIKSGSCGFAGDLQVFEFPQAKTDKEYSYIKLVGRCNSTDTWNKISEIKIFGYNYQESPSYTELPAKIYPNPAKRYVTIRIEDENLVPEYIQIVDMAGTIVLREELDPDVREFTVPLDIKKGKYILQLGSGVLTLFSQRLIVIN